MANEIQLGIRFTGDSKGLVGSVQVGREQFRQLATDAQKAGEAVSGGFTSAARGVRSISEQMEQAKLALAGYLSVSTAIASASWVMEQASAIRSIDARLKVATSSADGYRQAQAGVFEMANRFGQAVGDTAGTFARLNPAIEQLGGTAAVTLRMMEALAAATKLSGATTAESGALMLQFSQAMGSGVVQGDEFRSMMETAAPLMREVAAVLGKTTGQLRQMSAEGKLTSEVFGNAVLKAVDKLKARAESIPQTFEQSAQALKNSMARVAESFLSGLQGESAGDSFSKRLADGLAEAVPQAKTLGADLRALSGTVTALVAGYATLRVASALGPMIEGTARAAVSTGQLALAVQQGRAVDVQSAEAMRLRAAASLEAARAGELQAAAELAHLQVSRDALIAERALAQARLAAANPQLQAAQAAGALSYAYKMADEAAKSKSVSLLHLADISRSLAVVERDLAAAQGAAAVASAGAATASKGYEAAAAAASVAGRAKAAAVNLASGALAAMGGPVGAAIIGLTALAWWLHSSSKEAAALETALDQARTARERLDKEKKFGTGDAAAQREAIAALKAQIASEEDLLGNPELSSFAESRVNARIAAYKKELAAAQAALTEFEQRAAQPAAGGTLSDTSAFDTITKQYKWREKLERDHQEELLKLETAALAKLNAAKTDAERKRTETDYLSARAALQREQSDAIKALPDEKVIDALMKGRSANYLRILDETQKAEVDIQRRRLDSGAIGFDEYAGTRRSMNKAFTTERVSALQQRMGRADPLEKAGLQVQIEQFRQSSGELEQELTKEQDALAQRRMEALRAITADATGQTGSALEKAGAEFGKRFQDTAIRAASGGDEEMASALSQLWTRLASRAQFDDVKKRFEELQAELQLGVEQLRTSADGKGLEAWLGADKAEADLRARLIPALQETQTQMQALAGTSPDLQKAAAEAARALNQVQTESRKLAERGDWTVGISRGVEAYGKQAVDVAGQVEQAWGRAASNMEDALINFSLTGKLNFTSMANSIIADILRIQIRQAASPLLSALGNAIGSYFGASSASSALSSGSSLSSGTNLDAMGGGQGMTIRNALGGAYDVSGPIHAFARGGIVDRPTQFRFANGGGFSNGLMGEAGPEAIVPLKRGSDGRLGVSMQGAGGGVQAIRVEIHNEGNPQEVSSATPRFDAEGLVVQIFTRDLGRNGPIAQSLTAFKARR